MLSSKSLRNLIALRPQLLCHPVLATIAATIFNSNEATRIIQIFNWGEKGTNLRIAKNMMWDKKNNLIKGALDIQSPRFPVLRNFDPHFQQSIFFSKKKQLYHATRAPWSAVHIKQNICVESKFFRLRSAYLPQHHDESEDVLGKKYCEVALGLLVEHHIVFGT